MKETPLLRIGIVPSLAGTDQEEAINCFDKLPNSPCSQPGFEVEIIDAIFKLLHWNYTLVIADEYGSVSGASGTGLIGMVHRGEVDTGASAMRFLPDRMSLVDFAYPIWYFKQSLTIAKPQAYSYRHFVFTPFDPFVWLLLAVTVLLCVLLDWAVNCLLLLRHRTAKRRVFASVISLQNYVGMLLMQNVNLPRFASCTVIVSFYAFFSFVLTNYYESVMTGLLAVPLNRRVPFYGIDKLIPLLETKEKLLVYFTEGTEPMYPESLKARFKASLVGNPIQVSPSLSTVDDIITHQGGVYFGSEFEDKIPFRVSDSIPDKGFITVRDDTVASTMGSFIFPKNSTYLKRFNNALIHVLPGVHRIKGRYPGQRPYPSAEYSAWVGGLTLTLDHLWEIFPIWLTGLSLAVLCWLLELYGWRRKNQQKMASEKNNTVGMLFNHLNWFQVKNGRSAFLNRDINYFNSTSTA
uniref:Solute-binding protein family 3/N-terminal domain-containing protein n=1 Tax=Plectus sambesii TaxID=2011161 RepID=A0A914WBJ6_9BILA